jgi:hypothetical protein
MPIARLAFAGLLALTVPIVAHADPPTRRQGRLDPPCLGRHRASLMYRAVAVGAGIRSRVIGAGGEASLCTQ